MKSRKRLMTGAIVALAIFSSGLLVGARAISPIAPARADEMKWSEVADDPEFRAAVIKVIDSCIVENAVIYCN